METSVVIGLMVISFVLGASCALSYLIADVNDLREGDASLRECYENVLASNDKIIANYEEMNKLHISQIELKDKLIARYEEHIKVLERNRLNAKSRQAPDFSNN